jgi:hypothetical protein
MRLRMPETSYKVGDKVIALGVANYDKVLRCEKAGVSGVGEFPKDYNTLKFGDVIQDGSITWAVVDLAPVLSVNGKTGEVIVSVEDLGAVSIKDFENLLLQIDGLNNNTIADLQSQIDKNKSDIAEIKSEIDEAVAELEGI